VVIYPLNLIKSRLSNSSITTFLPLPMFYDKIPLTLYSRDLEKALEILTIQAV
jgi:hypothetical protein